jgi:hypothetical protein
MRLEGPERYHLTISRKTFTVLCAKGTNQFSGFSTTKLPKLYVVSIDSNPVYVGITKQPIRSRLRVGWNAKGKGGYYGYAWRYNNKFAVLHVWCHTDAENRNHLDVQTIEAEVVYLVRSAGQWPKFQTEIHFRPSNRTHRKLAKHVLEHLK